MLSPGQRLGPYEIVGALGAGGMGEVYRARDNRLDRDVALKILPAALAQDPDRLMRFTREAKTLAAVNHPNIATIFGVEDGALVMELVEGEDLSVVLAHGPLPVLEALPIVREIASALEAAHAAGIVHRDLKPSNIKVRPDGVVKVLDFGLAKAVDPAPASALSDATANSPTVTTAGLTGMGVILGTAAYIAPEQARGKPVDRRADVWAFGCVLFEMLTGRRAFAGDDVSEILASILRAEPDWAALPDDVPAAVRRLLRHCLQKDPRQRLRDMGDAQIELSDLGAEPGSAAPPRRSAYAGWLAALVVAAGAALALGRWSAPSHPAAAVVVTRFTVPLPEGLTMNAPNVRHVAVSPDGTTVVIAAGHRLYRRRLDEVQPTPILDVGDADPFLPVFSPDGQFVAYQVPAGRALAIRKVRISGGPTETIAERVVQPTLAMTYSDLSLTWSGDHILGGDPSGIIEGTREGEGARTVVSVDTRTEVASHPQRLADGRLVFTLRHVGRSGLDANDIVVQDAAGARRVVVKGGAGGVVLPSGHLVYSLAGDLVAVPIDEAQLRPTGSPVVLATGVALRWAVSASGTLVLESAGNAASAPRRVTWVDRSGREEPVFERAGQGTQINNLRLSPDRTQAAFTLDGDIWIWTFARARLMRLTLSQDTNEYNPAWTPDGRRLVFDSAPVTDPSKRQIVSQSADGTGSASVLTAPPGGWPDVVAPRTGTLVFHTLGALPSLMAQPIGPAGTPQELVRMAFNGDISPDGHWLAYQSMDTGHAIFVQPFPDVNAGRWQVSTGAGTMPLWSRNGKELFFIDPGGMLISAAISADHGFVAGPPTPLFRVNGYEQPNVTRNYDVSLDGKRFLFSKPPPTASTLTVVSNWLEELKAKVPVR